MRAESRRQRVRRGCGSECSETSWRLAEPPGDGGRLGCGAGVGGEPRSGRRSGADPVRNACRRVRCGARSASVRSEGVGGAGRGVGCCPVWGAGRAGQGQGAVQGAGSSAGRRGRGAGRGGAALARRGERIAPGVSPRQLRSPSFNRTWLTAVLARHGCSR